jgi:hypothetical protein
MPVGITSCRLSTQTDGSARVPWRSLPNQEHKLSSELGSDESDTVDDVMQEVAPWRWCELGMAYFERDVLGEAVQEAGKNGEPDLCRY